MVVHRGPGAMVVVVVETCFGWTLLQVLGPWLLRGPALSCCWPWRGCPAGLLVTVATRRAKRVHVIPKDLVVPTTLTLPTF